MLDPVPARPSQPRTQRFFALATFALLYGVALFFYARHVWPSGGFEGGLQKHAAYWLQGVRATVFHHRKAAALWDFYLQFLSDHRLWAPLIVQALGAFVALPALAGWVISRIPFNDQTEFHVRGLRYEPDFEKSVALLRAFVDGLKRKRERKVDRFASHPKSAVTPSLAHAVAPRALENIAPAITPDKLSVRGAEKHRRYTARLLQAF